MALARINGPMLQSTLERQGTNLSIVSNVLLSSTPTVIFDVVNNRLGVNTSTPQYTLDVNGNSQLGNIVIYNNILTSTTGKIALGSIANVTLTGGTPDQIVYTDGAGNLAFGSLALLAGLEGFTANNIIVGTVTQSSDGFGTSALTTGMDVATAIYTLDNILGNISNISGNVITTGNLFLRGVTGYSTVNNVLITDGTGNTSFVSANTLPAIVSINANTSSVTANLSAFETWANATFVTATTETQLSANVGAYQIWANANIGTLYLANISTNANLGAYQIYANANAAIQATAISTIDANVGAYQIYANANAAIQATAISTIDANVGAFETYANLYIGAAAYGNANVATYLPHYTGNLYPGNITSVFYGNVHSDYISGNNGNVITITGTGALSVPVGTTSNRPVGHNGYVRFNTDTPALEYFDGSIWVPITNTVTDQQIIPDGTNTTYTLDQESTEIGIIVSINGVLQNPNSAYTVTGNQITFYDAGVAYAPPLTDIIDVRFLGASVTINNTLSDNLSVSGNITLTGILQSPLTTKTSTSAGTAGQVCYDANYIYVCTATNTWKRVALTGGVF